MAYENVNDSSRRKRNKCFILFSFAVLAVLGIVLVVVFALKVSNSGKSLKKVITERCESYLEHHSSTARMNDCKTIWETFEQAYVGRDPCSVPPESYDLLMKSVKQDITCNTKLFWSKMKNLVHAFTNNHNCLLTIEDTLIGYLFNSLTWCSKNGSKETFTEDCPSRSYCGNNPVSSFWLKASSNFAVTACGNVSAMLNGSLEAPFNPASVFGSVEVKNLDPKKVDSLTVLLVTKQTDTTTCKSSSFQELRSALDPKIAYNCREVPYSRVEDCIADKTIPCNECF